MRIKTFTTSALLFAAGLSHAADDQQAVAPDAATALEEIVVYGSYGHSGEESNSATGLALTARETPQSISIITREQMEDQGMLSVFDVLNFTTGVSIKAVDRGRNQLSARGFDITNFQIDGVPVVTGNIGLEETRTAQYERVEVVRGATGLLSGAGEPSAAVNLVRKHADSRVVAGTASLEGGSWDRLAGTADLTMPLNATGSVRARVVADAYRQDAFIDLEETQGYLFYAVVDADLGERTRLSLGASQQRDERSGVMWSQLPYWYSDGTRTHWPRSTTTGTHWNQWDTTEQTAFVNLAHDLAGEWLLRGDLNYHRRDEDSKLLWMTGFPDPDSGEGMDAWPYWYQSSPDEYSLSLTARGPFVLFERRHELVLGALYSRLNDGWTNRDPIDPAPAGDFNAWDGSYPEPAWGERYLLCCEGPTVQSAVYAAARLTLADPLKLIVGARVSDWKHEAAEIPVYGEAAYTERHRNVFTPYAGLLYDVTEWLSAYASATSIFKPQNARDADGRFLDPVEGNSYEGGLKADLLEGRLHATAAVFRTEQDNFASSIGTDPDTGLGIYRAIDGTVVEGHELELYGKVTRNWNLNLGWASFSARGAEGETIQAHHPRRALNLASRYDFGGALDGASVGGAMKWESRPPKTGVNPGTGEEERIGQPSYALLDLMARYAFSDAVSAQLNVYNVLDETYYSQNSWFAGYVYGEPRNARLTLEYVF